jgi:hypothetical protein
MSIIIQLQSGYSIITSKANPTTRKNSSSMPRVVRSSRPLRKYRKTVKYSVTVVSWPVITEESTTTSQNSYSTTLTRSEYGQRDVTDI